MPRVGKSEIAERMTRSTPRLVVVNSSTSQGRSAVMLRVRPTILARLREVTVGPAYLIIEHALTRLMDDLEALPPGTMQSLNAFDMDPSPEDWALIDVVPGRRKKREASNAAGDGGPGGGSDGADRKVDPPKNRARRVVAGS